MNWTGGRLKRHYKANANHALKSQKQYFAKATQKLRNGPVPTPPKIFSLFDAHLPPKRRHDVNHTPIASPRPSPPPKSPLHQTHRVDKPRRSMICDRGLQRITPEAKSKRKPTTNPKHTHKPESLYDIKHWLLQNSDWAGLAIAKPVSITFMPAEEMEQIGRRRKVMREERRRKVQNSGQHVVRHNLIRPFQDPRSKLNTPPAQPTDLSIRLESNIHRTLTTQSSIQAHPHSTVGEPTPSDSMLLDKFESRTKDYSPSGEAEFLYFGSQPQEEGCVEGKNLVSLSEARDLKSFDEILERSSSVVRQVQPSSTPFGDPRPTHQTAVSSTGLGLSSNPVIQAPSSTKEHTPPSQRANYASVAKFVFPGGGGQERSWCQLPLPPKFTLDHQAARERETVASDRHSEIATSIGSLRKPQRPSAMQKTALPSRRALQQHVLETLSREHRSEELCASIPLNLVCGSSPPPHDSVSYGRSSSLKAHYGKSLVHSVPPELRKPKNTVWEKGPVRSHKAWMQRYKIAKEQHQESMRKGGVTTGKPMSQFSRLGDENEAWMRFVFPRDFGRIQTAFKFGTALPKKPISKTATFSSCFYETRSPSLATERSQNGQCKPHQDSLHQSLLSAPTTVNATIFKPKGGQLTPLTCQTVQSDPNFLSRFSPMEGVFDERLGDISMYKNAADTEKSSVSLPHAGRGPYRQDQRPMHTPAKQIVPAKRKGVNSVHYGERQHYTTREILQPLAQPCWKPEPPITHEGYSHRIPLQGPDRIVPGEHVRKPDTEHGGLNGHQEGVFPFGYSPVSSQRSRTPQHQRTVSPYFQAPSTSAACVANEPNPHHTSSTFSWQSPWQISTGTSSEKPLSDTTPQRQPLFGNGQWPPQMSMPFSTPLAARGHRVPPRF